MAHEEWLERAEIYSLSALDGDELTQFEAHLGAGCPVCERHVRETRGESSRSRAIPPAPHSPAAGQGQTASSDYPCGCTIDPGKHEIKMVPVGHQRWCFCRRRLLITMTWSLYTTRQELQRLQKEVASIQAGRFCMKQAFNSSLIPTPNPCT